MKGHSTMKTIIQEENMVRKQPNNLIVPVRQSNFELLRLMCIFGIVTMHTYGIFYGNATGANLVYGVLINSLFNTCVTLFVLISGYFGINGTIRKIVKLEMEVLFYSVLSMVIIGCLQDNWNTKDVLKAFLPVSSCKYWYITSYMLILIFSKYLNKVPERLEKKEFQQLLLLMFFIFSVVPTLVLFHVMEDGGKGVANMLLVYYTGRYIRLYYDKKINNPKKIFIIGAGIITLGFILNLILTILRGGTGVCAPFARDCSSIIFIASITIFLTFKHLNISSNLINCLAKHVVAVYLFEVAMKACLSQFFDINIYKERWYLFAVIAAYTLVTIAGCMLMDVIRCFIAKPIENAIYSVGRNLYRQIYVRLNKYIVKD